MKVLFLDDEEVRFDIVKAFFEDLTWVKNSNEAIKELNAKKYDLVFLDHDLGYYDNSVPVAKELIKLPTALMPDKIVVHSLNTVGARNLIDILLEKYKTNQLKLIPFYLLSKMYGKNN